MSNASRSSHAAWRLIAPLLVLYWTTIGPPILRAQPPAVSTPLESQPTAEEPEVPLPTNRQAVVGPTYRNDIRSDKVDGATDFIFRLPHTEPLADGTVRLSPWLQVVGEEGVTDNRQLTESSDELVAIEPLASDGMPRTGAAPFAEEFLTPGVGRSLSGRSRRMSGGRLSSLVQPYRQGLGWSAIGASRGNDRFLGLGYERLGTAAFQMDNAEPYNHFGVRMESAVRYRTPDIAEYFFAKTPDGRGPENPLFPGQAEASVNYTDLIMTTEAGGPKMSVVTQLPIRFLDPVINANTAGLSDMSIATKLVMLGGNDWRLTQIFRTYINTGAVSHGLGTGHVSMEPGFAFAWRPRTRLALHGELKYWFPIAADPTHAGQILRYGLGANRVFFENDHFAILESLEFVAFSVQDGRKTVRDEVTGLPIVTDLDGDTIINVYPGVWFVSESDSKLDVGLSSGFRLTGDQLYDQLLRLEVRFGF